MREIGFQILVILIFLSSLVCASASAKKMGGWHLAKINSTDCKISAFSKSILKDGRPMIEVHIVSKSAKNNKGYLNIDIKSPYYSEVFFSTSEAIIEVAEADYLIRENHQLYLEDSVTYWLIQGLSNRQIKFAGRKSKDDFFELIPIDFRGFINALFWMGKNCNVYTDNILPGLASHTALRLEAKQMLNHDDWQQVARKLHRKTADHKLLTNWWAGTPKSGEPSHYIRQKLLEFSLSDTSLYPARFLTKNTIEALDK